MKNIIWEKIKESAMSVAPITVIVVLLNFLFEPMPLLNLLSFVAGAFFLVLGMFLYNIGSDAAISNMGSYLGTNVTKTKKIAVILIVSFLVGIIVTVAEPSILVLSSQIGDAIPTFVLVVTLAVGVGLFLLLSMLRIFLKIGLNVILLIFYGILFLFSIFVDQNFVPLAFDSGGVTTGPLVVPFVMAFGVGVTSNLGQKHSRDNSFGTIALCAVGPMIMVLLLGMFFNPEIAGDTSVTPLADYGNFGEVLWAYLQVFPSKLYEVGIAFLPIVLFFLIFQFATTKVNARQLRRIFVGVAFAFVGLSVFLMSVDVGFMASGSYVGGKIAASSQKWLLVPIGMVIGASIILAEPAVHVLNKNVEEITDGHIKRSTMLLVLSIATACSVGLAMMRVLTGIAVWWVVVPGYVIALTLSFFVPKIFVGIGFDSGSVSSGPMTTTFLLPFAIGACASLNGNMFTDAFGIVTTVSMTPVIALQVLGVVYKIKIKRSEKLSAEILRLIELEGDEIIELVREKQTRRRHTTATHHHKGEAKA